MPELTTKTTIINFMITVEGLREQLLNLVVRQENEELDKEREYLLKQQHND
jgi:dynein heavy chain